MLQSLFKSALNIQVRYGKYLNTVHPVRKLGIDAYIIQLKSGGCMFSKQSSPTTWIMTVSSTLYTRQLKFLVLTNVQWPSLNQSRQVPTTDTNDS
ncbi:hypothetical protein N482_09725 [Pseudoalteromonas luteoviolacea NCIMB 1942]|uniref:Uncharacterized protein n=1 Tax=Pseudoalteromonas luteoviolacea NCIMB 1942 TaxID=1365253 RepID=A0A167CAE1_9GAMM|nr:hypothetical protein N482_09725 [Pseudoalteromonas luteoviolacea NCIMB 1942]